MLGIKIISFPAHQLDLGFFSDSVESLLRGHVRVKFIFPRSIEIESVYQHHHIARVETVQYLGYLSVCILRTPVVDGFHGSGIGEVQHIEKGIEVFLQEVHVSVAWTEVVVYPYRIGRLDHYGIIAAKVLRLVKHSTESIVEFHSCLSLGTFCKHGECNGGTIRRYHNILILRSHLIYILEERNGEPCLRSLDRLGVGRAA